MRAMIRAGIMVALLLAPAAGVMAEPLPWGELPSGVTIRFNNRYRDRDANFDNSPMSRKVLDLENDKQSSFTFPPPNPSNPEARRVLSNAVLTNGARREEVFEVARAGKNAKYTGYQVTYRDGNGKQIRSAKFDLTEPALKTPADLYCGNALIFLFMGMPFEEGYEQNFIGWTNPQIAYEATIEVTGVETVTVPAGTFECYRVEVSPVVSDYFGSIVGALVRPFVPPFIIWYMTAAPHYPVRIEGGVAITPSLDVPVVIRELTAIETGEEVK